MSPLFVGMRGSDGAFFMPEQTEPYRVKMLRRARLQGQLFVVGQVVTIEGDTALRSAAGLVSTLQARPADERTERDVALYRLTR